MDIISIASSLGNVANVKKISEHEYEIITGAKINVKTPIKMYLVKNGNELAFVDKQNTLKYMSQIYELKSTDVKNCIGGVIKLYGFSIVGGELFAPIASDKKVLEVFYNFIICVGQLANMLVFFDKD